LFTAQIIWPFPEAAVEELADSVEQIIVPEMNLGQIALEVERVAGRKKVVRVNRANGEMVTPDMIVSAVEA
jgi:2-oxoglutarate ferredoxin oxidoreductase subunit alpha